MLKLVCDHCNLVIEDGSFKELQRSPMTQDLDLPDFGIQRSGDQETNHYHEECAHARRVAADAVRPEPGSKPPPLGTEDHPEATQEPVESLGDLPPDHPLRTRQVAAANAQAEAERIAGAPLTNDD